MMYNEPGRMVGRVSLRDDKTLFLFIFAEDADTPMHDLPAQKQLVRTKFGNSGWECRGILDALDDAPELYFDRVSQIQMEHWSRGRVALVGDAAYCVSLLAGQGSALAMTGAYILAGELAKAAGKHDIAFANYEKILRGFVEKKQRGAAFRIGPRAEDAVGIVLPQSGLQGGGHSRARPVYIWARHYRHATAPRLSVATPNLVGHNLSGARR